MARAVQRRWTEADALRAQLRVVPPEGRGSHHRPGGILCLDLAGVVGWAYGDVDDFEPLAGVWRLPQGKGPGAKFAAFENELIDTLAARRPRLVLMEAPMDMRAQVRKSGNEAAARQQYGLAAYCEGECHRLKVEILEADVNPVRMAVIGRSRWPEGETKPAIVAWCQARGWDITDHNAADAAVLWMYACLKQGKRV